MESNIKYQEGVMGKDPNDMTDAELSAWEKQCAKNARTYLFSINQPLVYIRKDGRTEYKNGNVMIVR
jgi:hypothetical protein